MGLKTTKNLKFSILSFSIVKGSVPTTNQVILILTQNSNRMEQKTI